MHRNNLALSGLAIFNALAVFKQETDRLQYLKSFIFEMPLNQKLSNCASYGITSLFCFSMLEILMHHSERISRSHQGHAIVCMLQYYPEKICVWFEKLMTNSGLSDETVVPTSKLRLDSSKDLAVLIANVPAHLRS